MRCTIGLAIVASVVVTVRAARADVAPPAIPCDVESRRRAGEECVSCVELLDGPRRCARPLAQLGFKPRCAQSSLGKNRCFLQEVRDSLRGTHDAERCLRLQGPTAFTWHVFCRPKEDARPMPSGMAAALHNYRLPQSKLVAMAAAPDAAVEPGSAVPPDAGATESALPVAEPPAAVLARTPAPADSTPARSACRCVVGEAGRGAAGTPAALLLVGMAAHRRRGRAP